MSEIVVPVEIPLLGDERRKNWAKVVHRVDDGKASGWAFEGDFIAAGGVQDVPAGAVIVVYGERGSHRNPQPEAKVFVVHADGTLSQHAAAKGRAWARTIRDRVAELVAEQNGGQIALLDWSPELMRYSDEALSAELTRRRTNTS